MLFKKTIGNTGMGRNNKIKLVNHKNLLINQLVIFTTFTKKLN